MVDLHNHDFAFFGQAEFMEHDEKPLPIDTRLLGALAEKVIFLFWLIIPIVLSTFPEMINIFFKRNVEKPQFFW